MRLVIQGKELEFRVQERRVVTCSAFHQGKEIAFDLAICAPGDKYDPREGEKIAVGRVADQLWERQRAERHEAMVKVDQVFSEVGAISGNVELPHLEEPSVIVEKVMAKLGDRRIKKAKEHSLKALKDLCALMRGRIPSPSFPSFQGLLFVLSPFLRPGSAIMFDSKKLWPGDR